MNDSEQPDSDEWVSKTRKKKDMHYRQQLGEQLLTLKTAKLDSLDLPEELRLAIEEARRIKKNEALRRHKQYLGKLMRDIDITAIEARLQQIANHQQVNTQAFHALEQLREKLIAGDNQVIGELIAEHPEVDRQKLRQLVKNAKQETRLNAERETKENKQGRALFRFLREL